MGRRASALVLLFGCGLAVPALAVPPVVTYAPLPDQYLAQGEGCAMAASEAAPAELDFGSGGNCTVGANCNVVATPSGGSGSGPVNTTIIGCNTVTLSGNGTVGVQLPPGGIAFQGATTTPANIGVTCTPGTQSSTARLCCTESRGGNTFNPVWDVSCPSPTNPEFGSTPAGGSTLPLTTTVGGSVNTMITAGNTGTGNLTIVPSGLSGVLSVAPSGMQSLAPGGSQQFTVTCNPVSSATVQQTLAFDTNDADEDPVLYTVTCTGTVPPTPEIDVTPTPPGPLGIATTQPANGQTTFTVTNTGNANLTVSSIGGLAAPFSVMPAGATIAGGGNQVFTVTCSGASVGVFNDQLTINSNDADEMAVNLNVNCNVGSAPLPEFQSSPPSPGPLTIAYTLPTTLGQTSVTVQNVGTATLQIASASGLSGFLSVSPPAATVNSGQSQLFTVTCNRNSAGADNQILTFSTNDADEGSVGYNVACNVQAAAAPEFQSVPAPPGSFMINTNLGVPAQAMLAVQNVGSATLQITGITQPSDNATVAPNAPINVGAGSSTNLTVTCSAGSAGSFMRTFTLMTNDSDEGSVGYTVTCNVAGPPAQPEYESSPPSDPAPGALEFGLTTVTGSDVADTLLVTNTGPGPLSATVTGLAAPFSVVPTMATLGSGQTQGFVITCSAASTGSFSDQFSVTTNDADEGSVPYDIACQVDPSPPVYASMPFNEESIPLSTLVGTSAVTTLRIMNDAPVGGEALEVTIPALDPPLSLSTTGPLTIPAGGGGFPIRIECSPTDEITLSQELVIDTNAPNIDPAIYFVSCEGVPPPTFTSVPPIGSSFVFSTALQQPVSDFLRVINEGRSDLVLTTSGLGGILVVQPDNAVIPRGEDLFFEITCTAESASTAQRTLVFATNDPTQPAPGFPVSCVVPPRAEVLAAARSVFSSTFRDPLFRDGFE